MALVDPRQASACGGQDSRRCVRDDVCAVGVSRKRERQRERSAQIFAVLLAGHRERATAGEAVRDEVGVRGGEDLLAVEVDTNGEASTAHRPWWGARRTAARQVPHSTRNAVRRWQATILAYAQPLENRTIAADLIRGIGYVQGSHESGGDVARLEDLTVGTRMSIVVPGSVVIVRPEVAQDHPDREAAAAAGGTPSAGRAKNYDSLLPPAPLVERAPRPPVASRFSLITYVATAQLTPSHVRVPGGIDERRIRAAAENATVLKLTTSIFERD